uniref:Uncharacterized protein n=1 Tax=Astyanax mexicanus TaxID=7994 RepID=A0A8B9RLH0_ASTMX
MTNEKSSKLNTLVTKLHEFLDHSPEEETAAPQFDEISSAVILYFSHYNGTLKIIKFSPKLTVPENRPSLIVHLIVCKIQ